VRIFIYADASVGPPNPGPAGVGFVIRYPVDRVWTTVAGSEALTWRGNHEAEYKAAIRALTRAARMLPPTSTVLLRTDSRLVVEQTNRDARILDRKLKRPSRRLARRIEYFDRVKIEWIPRRENKAADMLSRAAVARSRKLKR
jgi:ribonuclease HI